MGCLTLTTKARRSFKGSSGSSKKWIFSNIAVRTWNLAQAAYLKGEPIVHAPSVCKRKTLEEQLKGFSWNMTFDNCTKIWHYITVSNKRRKEQSFARRPTRISLLFRRVCLTIWSRNFLLNFSTFCI
jgi:hypothetical protein